MTSATALKFPVAPGSLELAKSDVALLTVLKPKDVSEITNGGLLFRAVRRGTTGLT